MQFHHLPAHPAAVGRCLQQPNVGVRGVCSSRQPSLQAATLHRGSCCSHQHDHEEDSKQLPSAFLAGLAAVCVTGSATAEASAAAVAAAATGGVTPVDPSTYVPGPVEVGWQIWFAAVVSTVPFVIGAYEFGKRILIQRRCKVCNGSGLVACGKGQRKCPECGGFFPWISWGMFLSANARPGNGGPLLQPRGQTSVLYTVPPRPSVDASLPAPTAAAAASSSTTPNQDSAEQPAATGDDDSERH